MLHTIRHIARVVTPVLLVLFFIVLAADEYCDARRAMQDARIESCMELEAYDFEWDDDDEPDSIENNTPFAGITMTVKGTEVIVLCSSAKQSDKQLRGLVRQYAPRKSIVRTNYIWT